MAALAGTYILDSDGNVLPMLAPTKSLVSYKMRCFSAAFPPIEKPMPVCNQGTDIALFFYIFANHKHLDNVHIYVKSALYAYKQLIEHTNILDCGTIRFYIDKKCEHIAYPYFRATGLEPITECSYDFGEGKNFSGYFPLLNHQGDCRYRFKIDSDMWFVNLNNAPAFDFREMVARLDTLDDGIFGHTITKTDPHARQFYYPPWRTPEEHGVAKKKLLELFGVESLQGARHIAGFFNGVRAGSDALYKLLDFYEKYGKIFPDDEGFWSIFLTKHSEIRLHEMLPEQIPNTWIDTIQEGNCLLNVGSGEFMDYRFDKIRRNIYDSIMEGL